MSLYNIISNILRKSNQAHAVQTHALKQVLENETELFLHPETFTPSTLLKALNTLAPALENNKTLTNLEIHGNLLTIEIAKTLENNTTLTRLNIYNGKITDEALDSIIVALSNNPNLTHLIFNCSIKKNALTKLSLLLKNNTSFLKHLKISSDYYTRPNLKELAMALEENSTLEALDISNLKIDNEEADSFFAALKKHPSLTHFNMDGNPLNAEATQKLVQALQENQTLTHLSYAHNNLKAAGAALFVPLLRENKTLTYLDLSHNKMMDPDLFLLMNALKDNKHISELNLSENIIGKSSARTLADFLRGNETLTSLNLERCDLNQHFETIAIALQDNKKLKKLSLAHNLILEPHAQRALAKALKENNTLNSLDLSGTSASSLDLSHTYIETLSGALAQNKVLTEVELGYNHFTQNRHFEKLILALQANKNLTSLGLSHNEIKDENISVIIKLLKNTSKLTTLNLCGNKITSAGIQLLANSLAKNQNLTSLDLTHNPIDIKGITALTEALKNNSSLTELKLTFIVYDYTDAYEAIEELLKVNTTITTLDIPYPASNDSQKIYDNIRKALKRNQIIAEKERQKRQDLLFQHIQESIPQALGGPAGIIAEYAGAPPKSQAIISPSSQTIKKEQPQQPLPSPPPVEPIPQNSVPLVPPLDMDKPIPLPKPDTNKSTEPEPVPIAPLQNLTETKPVSEPKNLSLFERFKNWLREKWNNLNIFIHNLSNTFTNKFSATPKTTHLSNSNQDKLVEPDKTIKTPKVAINTTPTQPVTPPQAAQKSSRRPSSS